MWAILAAVVLLPAVAIVEALRLIDPRAPRARAIKAHHVGR